MTTLMGVQTPRILYVPQAERSRGNEVTEFAASLNLQLDPWQSSSLVNALGVGPEGLWAAFEVGLDVPRQNGKGELLIARMLAGLFLFDERLQIFSSHSYKTAAEHFIRLLAVVDSNDHLSRQVKQVRTSHGEEGIELRSGLRLRFMARTSGSGRGFSADAVYLDEAQILSDNAANAMLPSLSARPNPQVWYTFTAPNADVAPCEPISRLRERALGKEPGSLAYMEYSIEPHEDGCPLTCKKHDDARSPASWAKANPGLGHRITEDHMAREMKSMSAEGFLRERLGVGNWPKSTNEQWSVIAEALWASLVDIEGDMDSLALAVDITPSRSHGAVAAAGLRDDGLYQLDVIEHKRGTSWIIPLLVELNERHGPLAIVVDPAGPANSLIPALEAAGLPVVKMTARDMAAACGSFYDKVADSALRHLDQPELNAALAGAAKRNLGQSWAWARNGSVDISPLVAVTLALHGITTKTTVEETPKTYFWDPDAEDAA